MDNQIKLDHIPRVFISYAWSSEDHIAKVTKLAERLMYDGIDTILDKWDLKEGQDKYKFMEQCINDSSIDRVLIICDEKYSIKANNREGGVGDETIIISPEIYGKVNQEKFLPVIFQKDSTGVALCPTYLKSRIYFDLTSDNEDYEKEYENLLRNIWHAPKHIKPKVGPRPTWLDSNTSNLSRLRDLIQQINHSGDSKREYLSKQFQKEFYIRTSDYLITDGSISGQKIYEKIVDMKELRDLFIDFLEILIGSNSFDLGDYISNIIEDLYNNIAIPINRPHINDDTDQFKYLIWEIFICITSMLFKYKQYKAIYDLLNHTYFISVYSHDLSHVEPVNYVYFRHYSRWIEEDYKPKTDRKKLFTLSGDLLINREKQPDLTKESIIQADILLFQLSYVFKKSKSRYGSGWFPTTYVYGSEDNNYWIRLKSKAFCKSIFPLFCVSNIEELINIIFDCPIDSRLTYPGSFASPPQIMSNMKREDIGSMD